MFILKVILIIHKALRIETDAHCKYKEIFTPFSALAPWSSLKSKRVICKMRLEGLDFGATCVLTRLQEGPEIAKSMSNISVSEGLFVHREYSC